MIGWLERVYQDIAPCLDRFTPHKMVKMIEAEDKRTAECLRARRAFDRLFPDGFEAIEHHQTICCVALGLLFTA
jgi:hypothetical protein